MKGVKNVHDNTRESLNLLCEDWIPRQAGVKAMTPSVRGSALGEVAYLHCSWNLLLYPLKMNK